MLNWGSVPRAVNGLAGKGKFRGFESRPSPSPAIKGDEIMNNKNYIEFEFIRPLEDEFWSWDIGDKLALEQQELEKAHERMKGDPSDSLYGLVAYTDLYYIPLSHIKEII